MKAGDEVVYLKHPTLFGVGRIERTLPNGQVVVRFQEDELGERFTEELFAPHELELHSAWCERTEAQAA